MEKKTREQNVKVGAQLAHYDSSNSRIFKATLNALNKIGGKSISPKNLGIIIAKNTYNSNRDQDGFNDKTLLIFPYCKHSNKTGSLKAQIPLYSKDKKRMKNEVPSSVNGGRIQNTNIKPSCSKSNEESGIEEMDLMRDHKSPLKPNNQYVISEFENQEEVAAAIAIQELSKNSEFANKKKPLNLNEQENNKYFAKTILTDNELSSVNFLLREPYQDAKVSPLHQLHNSSHDTSVLNRASDKQSEQASYDQITDRVNLDNMATTLFCQSKLNGTSKFDSAVKTSAYIQSENKTLYHKRNHTLDDLELVQTKKNNLDYSSYEKSRRKSLPVNNQALISSKIGEELKKYAERNCFETTNSTFKRHTFKITKKRVGDLQCLELESPDDIINTKIFRLISCSPNSDCKLSSIEFPKKNYVNATQLRKAAVPVLGEGSFDIEEESRHNPSFVIVSNGPYEGRGVWVSLERARELVEEYEIESSPGLKKLLSDDPLSDKSKNKSLQDTNPSIPIKDENSYRNAMEPNKTESYGAIDSILSQLEQNNKMELISDKSINESSNSHERQYRSILPSGDPSRSEKFVNILPATKRSTPSGLSKTVSPQNSNLPPLRENTSLTSNQVQNDNQLVNNLSLLIQYFNILKSMDNPNTINSSKLNTPSTSIPSSSLPSPSSSTYSNEDTMNSLKSMLSKDLLSQEFDIAPKLKDTSLSSSSLNQLKGFQELDSTNTIRPNFSASFSETSAPIVYPSNNTEPAMYITVSDNVAVCIATIRKSTDDIVTSIMRRLDNDFINGTQLLIAGGIETERERSMILSFEMKRVRVPHKNSSLFGTWIPLGRALELAVTCSIQHTLGPFLEDNIESLFPSPLPLAITHRKRKISISPVKNPNLDLMNFNSPLNNHHLAALTLAALKNPVIVSKQSDTVHPSGDHISHTDPLKTIEKQLITHPIKTLKTADYTLKAPLFGNFDKTSEEKHISFIDRYSNTVHNNLHEDQNIHSKSKKKETFRRNTKSTQNGKKGKSIATDSDSISKDESEDTDTDDDVQEIRKEMRQLRNAAIAAMEVSSSHESSTAYQDSDYSKHLTHSLYPTYYDNDQSTSYDYSHNDDDLFCQFSSLYNHNESKNKTNVFSENGNSEEDQSVSDKELDSDTEVEVECLIESEFEYNSDSEYLNNFNGSSNNSKAKKLEFLHESHKAYPKSDNLEQSNGGKWLNNLANRNKVALKETKKTNIENGKAAKKSNKKQTKRNKINKSSSTNKGKSSVKTKNQIVLKIKKTATVSKSQIMNTIVNEDEEDEEVDIGGSDNDDDLR